MVIHEVGRAHGRVKRSKSDSPVRVKRKRVGISLAQLSRLTKISYTTLWRIENRLVVPRKKTIDRINSAIERVVKRSK